MTNFLGFKIKKKSLIQLNYIYNNININIIIKKF